MTRARRSLLVVLAAAAAVLLVVVAGRAILATRGAQTFITERVLNLINPPGQTIAVATTDGQWPGHIILGGVTIADREGVWLSIDRLTLDWHPTRLLRDQVVIDAAAAGRVVMTRLPLGRDTGGPPVPFDIDGLVRDLAGVHVEKLMVDTLVLEAAVLGEAVTARATGSLRDESGGKTLALDLARTDQPGRAVLTARADARVHRFALDAETQGFAARVDISVAKPAESLSGTLRLERTGEGARGFVVATFSGTRRDPVVAADVDVSDLSIGGRPIARVVGAVRAQRAEPGVYRLTGEGTLSDARLALPEMAAVTASEAQWSVNISQASLAAMTLESFRIVAGDTSLEVAGTMRGKEMRPATVTLRMKGVGRLAGMVERASTVTTVLTATQFTTAGQGEGTLRVNAASLPDGLPDLTGTARWSVDGSALRITDVTGLNQNLKVSGSSTWPRTGDTLDHGATHLTLAMALGFAEGALDVTADLKGPLDKLTAQIAARSARLGAGESAVTDLTATLAASRVDTRLEGALEARGTWRNAPLSLDATAKMADDTHVALVLKGASIAGAIDGEARVNLGNGLATGMLATRLDDITPLADALGIDARGALEASMSLNAANDVQNAEVRATLSGLASNPLSTQSLTLTAKVGDAWRNRRIDANVTAAAGQLVGRSFTKMTGHVRGTPAAYEVALDASGATPLLGLRARVSTGADTVIVFNALSFNDGALSAALTAPTTLTFAPDRIALDAVAATVAGGRLTGNASFARAAQTVAADLALQNVVVNAIIPESLGLPKGTMSGQLNVSGPLTDATATLRMKADFAADAINASPAFDLTVDARIADGHLDTMATVAGLSAVPARLTARVPLRLDVSGPRLNIAMDAPLTAAMTWNGNIAPLWRILPVDDHLLSGNAAIDLKVAGTFAAPQITGGVKVTGGSYENIPAGLVLRDVTLTVDTERGDSLALAMSARDTGRGRLTASGRLNRDAQGSWTADLAGDLDRLAVLARDEVTAAASGKVSYKGPLLAGVLEGNLAMWNAAIHLESTGVPEVPLLRSFAALKADTFDAAATSAPPAPMTLDLSLSMADPMTVEGRGLDSAWRGDLYVTGSFSQPMLVGGLAMERGTFGFVGQTFELESGTVTFTGGGRIDPQLNVVAVREVTGITVTVNVSGSASAPTITLSSRPALPQDEVLARLLFNRNMSELGPLESIQLAGAAADMSGLARGGISGVVRRALNLDTFSFGGQSGNAVVVGRQIGRNIFASVEQNVNNTNRVFTITWRLSRQFSLRSSARDQTGANFGVFWRKDY